MTLTLLHKLPVPVLTFLFVGLPALAAETATGSAGKLITDGLSAVNTAEGNAIYSEGTDLPALIGNIIQALLALIGVLFLVLAVYAGFLWMTAQGNEKKVQSAKDILKNAVIGLVLIVAAYAISDFVITTIIDASGPQTG